MKEIAYDFFKIEENGKKFSNWVENTVGKGEIARCEGLFGKGLSGYLPQGCSKLELCDTGLI